MLSYAFELHASCLYAYMIWFTTLTKNCKKINYSFIIVRETDLFCMNTYFLTHNIMTTGKRVKANKHDLTKERIRGSFSLLSLNLISCYS